jgi:hypothetical protein
MAARTDGSFAALRLMRPSDAASAARPKSFQATAIQDRRTDCPDNGPRERAF